MSSSMRRIAVHCAALWQAPSRTRTRSWSHSERGFSDVPPCTISSTRLPASSSSRPARRSGRLLPTSSTHCRSSRSRSVPCLPASPARESARSATDVTLPPAAWSRRARLSESSQPSPSVSLVPSLPSVHSTWEVPLPAQPLIPPSSPSTTENSSMRSSGLSKGRLSTVSLRKSLSAVWPSSRLWMRTQVSHSRTMMFLTALSSTRRMASPSRREISSASGIRTTPSPSSRPQVLYVSTIWKAA